MTGRSSTLGKIEYYQKLEANRIKVANLRATNFNGNNVLYFDIISPFPPNSFEEIALKNIAEFVRKSTFDTLNLNIVTIQGSDLPTFIGKLLDDSSNVLGLALFLVFNRFIDPLVTEPADVLGGLMGGGGNNLKYSDRLFMLWALYNLDEYINLFKYAGSDKNLITLPFFNIPEALGAFIEKWESLSELQTLTASKPFRATGDAKVQTAYANMNIKTYTGPGAGSPPEISKLLADGTLSGAEWANAYTDNLFGFFESAKYYYPNGIHQMQNICNMVFNENKLGLLSEVQRLVLEQAILSEFVDQKSYIDPLSSTMNEVHDTKNVEMLPLPSDFITAFMTESDNHYTNLENTGTTQTKNILASLKEFSAKNRENINLMSPQQW